MLNSWDLRCPRASDIGASNGTSFRVDSQSQQLMANVVPVRRTPKPTHLEDGISIYMQTPQAETKFQI